MNTITRLLILLLLFSVPLAYAQDDMPEESTAVGDTVLLLGQVTDSEGNPIPNATVEIWQTDANGYYDHPGDQGEKVDDFQYFGVALTDDDGFYAFLTIKPAPYEPRPTHIHFKVLSDDELLLISQFYFPEDFEDVQIDAVFGEAGETVILQAVENRSEDAQRTVVGNIVIDLNGAGDDALTPTARQAEGPFYPVVDFADYDNNLTNPETDEEPIPYFAEEADSEAG